MHGARRGLWFDEFRLGETYQSPGRTITEADLVLFSGLSGDYTQLHTDEEFAKRTAFRGRIAHGMLVQAVATGLGTRLGVFEGTIAALAEMVIRWRKSVYPGDTLRLRLTVSAIDPSPSRRTGAVRFSAAIVNQRDEVVSDGEWSTLMLRESPTPRAEVSA
jgi:acyl dehydratase